MLGRGHAKQGRREEAIREYRRSLEVHYEDYAAYAIGNELMKLGKWEEALAEFRGLLSQPDIDPDIVGYANLSVAHLLQRQGDWEEALGVYRDVAARFPDGVDILNACAWSLAIDRDVNRSDPPFAMELALKAVELEPEDAELQNTLGLVHYRNQNWQSALTALEKSMALSNSGDGYDWFLLAMTHRRLGSPDRAREWYTKAVDLLENSSDEYNQFQLEELRALRVEAEQLLGIDE